MQLVDRQGRDVKGIVSLQMRWYRVTNALTWKYIPCVGFFYPSFCLSFIRELTESNIQVSLVLLVKAEMVPQTISLLKANKKPDSYRRRKIL